MSIKTRRQIVAEVKAQGFSIDIDKWPRKLTFYRPDGEAMDNLPADPWSMERYLKKGFTLTPPVQPSNGDNGAGSVGALTDAEIAEAKRIAKAKREVRAERKKRKHERELKTEEKINA